MIQTKLILSIACCVAILSSFSNSIEPKKRHFLIGYIGTKNNNVWTGGYDTTMSKYPNLFEMVSLFESKYELTKCKIMAITEYSDGDRKEFWRGLK